MAANSIIAKIHIAKKDLRLDDDTYRDLLERVTGQRSAAGLTDQQAVAVLDAMRVAGWQAPARKANAKPTSSKIQALWADMCRLGIPKEPTDKGLRGFVRKVTGRDALEWLTGEQAQHVIEGLKAWRARELSKRGRAVK